MVARACPLRFRESAPGSITSVAMQHHLAQLNVARLLYPLDSSEVQGFVDALDPVNAAADSADGFVWRLQTEEGDATAIRVFDDDLVIVNLSVWETLDHLRAFVYGNDHRTVLRQRRQWFEQAGEPYLVLWWVPAGHAPSVEEAAERLLRLRRDGPAPSAFTMRTPYEPGEANS